MIDSILGLISGHRRFRRSMLLSGGEADQWVECSFYLWALHSAGEDGAGLPEPQLGRQSPHSSPDNKGVWGNGSWILIDSGLEYEDTAAEAAVADQVSTSVLLGRAGISPDRVSDVILTHLHWDHVDGLRVVTSGGARVWLSPVELDWARSLFSHDGDGSADQVFGVRRRDLEFISELERENRIVLVDPVAGPWEVAPGIRLVPCPGHTPGTLGVIAHAGAIPPDETPDQPRVETGGKDANSGGCGPRFFFTSDAAYLNENVRAVIPPGTACSAGDAARSIRMVANQHRGDTGMVVVPGHEPRLAGEYLEAAEGVICLFPGGPR